MSLFLGYFVVCFIVWPRFLLKCVCDLSAGAVGIIADFLQSEFVAKISIYIFCPLTMPL